MNEEEIEMRRLSEPRPRARANVQQARLDACKACPIYRPDDACPLVEGRLRDHRSYDDSACPEGRWDSVAYPSLATQAGNLVKAAARFAQSGFAVVDQAEFDRRRAICEGCKFMDKAQNRCRACGCALAVKPWSKAESCPHGLWEIRAPALEQGGQPIPPPYEGRAAAP